MSETLQGPAPEMLRAQQMRSSSPFQEPRRAPIVAARSCLLVGAQATALVWWEGRSLTRRAAREVEELGLLLLQALLLLRLLLLPRNEARGQLLACELTLQSTQSCGEGVVYFLLLPTEEMPFPFASGEY